MSSINEDVCVLSVGFFRALEPFTRVGAVATVTEFSPGLFVQARV